MDTTHLPAPNLPASDSPSLVLAHPTGTEKLHIWHLNNHEWRGPLSPPAYVRRENFIHNQPLTRDGGSTFWILVDTSLHTSTDRKVIASCETYKKRALVTRGSGKVEEVISHSIGNVFCDPQLRGRGYAARMMKEIGEILYTWQQENGRRADFTILYSDIGKKFYAKVGWQAFPSYHIALPSVAVGDSHSVLNRFPESRPLLAEDLEILCKIDEAQLRSRMKQTWSKDSGVQIALIPDIQTIQWHHAREEFIISELLDRPPTIKGAMVEGQEGERVWCIWTRSFGKTEAENVLHVLRLVIESKIERQSDSVSSLEDLYDTHILATASVLLAAQREAENWKMQKVEIWNPTPTSVLAARKLEPSAIVIERNKQSIPSLKWYGPKLPTGTVEWTLNEKYGWC